MCNQPPFSDDPCFAFRYSIVLNGHGKVSFVFSRLWIIRDTSQIAVLTPPQDVRPGMVNDGRPN